MLPELALMALLLTPLLACWQGLLPWLPQGLGARRLARPLAWSQVVLMGLALLLLAHAFQSDDFTLLYVAQHSNSRLPLPFKLAAVWGGHEGSLLFFLFALCLWNARLGHLAQSLATRARAQSVMGWLIVLLSVYLLTESNPFVRLFPPPFEGRDLNPMLQDVALILHPPLLYLGYVGFAASFALGITALWERRLDGALVRAWRPLARAAWGWLTAGIVLGAWWAYHELGWGGWWFWDPVENASLLPWLFGTALLHALAAFERRGLFGQGVLLLALLTFVMSLLGTFMVRAGVMSSVHAFAIDTNRGERLLLLLGAVALCALLLYGWRGQLGVRRAHFSLLSRESALACALALPLLGAAVVLIGTFYPLIHPLIAHGAISVGPPYFNALFVPLVLLALLGLILLPWLGWQQSRLPRAPWLWLLLALPPTLWLNQGSALLPGMATLLALWLSLTCLHALWRDGLRSAHLAHLALALVVLAASQLAGHTRERGLLLAPGQSATLGQYRVRLDAITPELGPNYSAERYHLTAFKEGKTLGRLFPERRHYSVRTMQMNEVGLLRLPSGDLYAVPGDKQGNRIALRLAYKPGASWLWLGGVLLALAGLLPLGRHFHRKRNQEASCPV
ncbi:heme lyase CcmF/NrfE family subunit [Aeromonas schubertii]